VGDGIGSDVGSDDGTYVGTDDGERVGAVVGHSEGIGTGTAVGIALGAGVGRLLGAGDGENVLTETDSTIAIDIPPASRRRRSPPAPSPLPPPPENISSISCSSRRRWPSWFAKYIMADVSVPSLTDWLSTFVTYFWTFTTSYFDTMTSGAVTSAITLMVVTVASMQTSSDKVALEITESSASRKTVLLKSSH
jgi:hypothetical protein